MALHFHVSVISSVRKSGPQASLSMARAQIPQPQAAVDGYFHEIQQK